MHLPSLNKEEAVSKNGPMKHIFRWPIRLTEANFMYKDNSLEFCIG